MGETRMVGMIVTGHGSFATGVTSGLRLLAGESENYEAVDFLPEDSVISLTEKLKAAAERLSGCSGILIFADLTGGSPFNVSIRMKLEGNGALEVIGGANLPSVLQGYMARMAEDDVSVLAMDVLAAGKEAMVRFEASGNDDDDYEE